MAELSGIAAVVAAGQAEQAELVADAASWDDLFGQQIEAPRGPGRPAGRRNRVTDAQAALILQSGLSPLGYLIQVLRDPLQPTERRIAAAVAAAPYVHRKQPVAVDVQASGGFSLVISTEAEGGGAAKIIDQQQGGGGGAHAVIDVAEIIEDNQ